MVRNYGTFMTDFPTGSFTYFCSGLDLVKENKNCCFLVNLAKKKVH